MPDRRDGGPAFPCGSYDPQNGSPQPPVYEGASLRDLFAMAALTGFLSAPDQIGDQGRRDSDTVARWAFEQADAMLAAREPKPDPETERQNDNLALAE